MGRMFLQAAYNYPFEYYVLDAEGAPCQPLCEHFSSGDFADYDTVLAFGQNVDVIGIEIEHVSSEALKVLEAQGKTVIPAADTLTIIKDKGLQKQHYRRHGITTPDYYIIDGSDAIDTDLIAFPFVQKLRTGGYDGKGVQVIGDADDLHKLWDEPSVIEAFSDIAKEIAVMVVKGQDGDIAVYPSVEMVFDAELNLVDYLFSPANITDRQHNQATALATQVANSFVGAGLFAVELFIDTDGEMWVNETAPRVHNSGHHTIEAAYCSQFEQMLRVLAGLPLGNTSLREPAAMINLLGSAGYQGQADIEGLDVLSQLDKTYLHWYGKSTTSAGRKMGHITTLGQAEAIEEKLQTLKQHVAVLSHASK